MTWDGPDGQHHVRYKSRYIKSMDIIQGLKKSQDSWISVRQMVKSFTILILGNQLVP